ncbi:MAG: response regulator [Cytophagales bacterium]|nr:response regulator [Cytophagales bacterium]
MEENRKKRIVVIEDFNTSRQIIKKTLENMGFIVDEASDGREALMYFNGSRIDMVITDYNMPNMNGAELVQYVRQKERYKYIPIFVLSTETSTNKQQKAKEAKITAWVKKPFDIQDFKKLVKRALD